MVKDSEGEGGLAEETTTKKNPENCEMAVMRFDEPKRT